MKKFLPIMLVFVALSSGCTIPILNIDIPGLGGPTVVQYEHDIVIIKSLEVVPNEIDAGQTAKVLAYIENRGDKKVGPVYVDLYDYCKGLLTPKVLTCGNKQVSSTQGKTKCTIDEMLPGEIITVMWSVCQNRADAVKVRTVCPSDGLKVLVRYPYETTSLTTISLISLSEMQREMIERTYKPVESYIAVGQGPIKPYLTVEDKQPVPVFDIMPDTSQTNSGVTNARTLLKLQLKNMGSGQLASTANNGQSTIAGIPGSKVVVGGIGGIGNAKSDLVADTSNCKFADASWNSEILRFVGKETSPYYCEIDLSGLAGKVERTTTRHITVDVNYTYVITKSALLTINPKIAG